MFTKFFNKASTIKEALTTETGRVIAANIEGAKTDKYEVMSDSTSATPCNEEYKHETHTSMSLALATDFYGWKVGLLPPEGILTSTIVETKILTGPHKGLWIKAKVLRRKEHAVDVKVLHPRKWSVVGVALDVPNQYIRPASNSKSYTIPIRFTLDSSVLYVVSNKQMKVDDLKWTVHRARKYSIHQIYFLHNGRWLRTHDPVPDDVIFCIIHRGDRSSGNLNVMVSNAKKQLLNSQAGIESDISSLEGACCRSRSYSTSYTNENR